MKKYILLITAVCLLSSCSNVYMKYVGKSYTPTSEPELFFSWDDVSRDYETMGYVDATPIYFGTIEEAQAAIEKKARECGADAVVFVDLNNPGITLTEQVTPTTGGRETRMVTATQSPLHQLSTLKATFIKYK